jgi:long-chain acyl-CoA synthetase
MPRQSLIDYLSQWSRNGRDTAFGQPSGYRLVRWSYRDVAGLAAQCARELEARGIGLGDRVLLWGHNSAEWVAAFRGCILRGAVAVPIDQGATPGFAGRVAQEVDAKLVIAAGENHLAEDARPRIILESLREDLARHSPEPYASPRAGSQVPLRKSFSRQGRRLILKASSFPTETSSPISSLSRAAMQPYLKWERHRPSIAVS